MTAPNTLEYRNIKQLYIKKNPARKFVFIHLPPTPCVFFSNPARLGFEDAIEVVTGSSYCQLNEMPDEEAAEVLKMTVALTKHIKVPRGSYEKNRGAQCLGLAELYQ